MAIKNEALFLGQYGGLEVADLVFPLFIILKQSIAKFERIKILDAKPDTFYSTNIFITQKS